MGRRSQEGQARSAAMALLALALAGCEIVLGIEDRRERAPPSAPAPTTSTTTPSPSPAPPGDASLSPSDGATLDAGDAEAGPPFVPTALPGLELWLSGDDDAITISAVDGEVESWQDRSGKGRHLGRLHRSAPSIQIAKFPQVPKVAARFTPGATYPAAGLGSFGWTIPQPLTIALAIHPTNTTPGRVDFVLGGSSVPTVGIARGGDAFQAVAGSGPTFSFVAAPGTWSASAHVVLAIYDGAASRLRVDGSEFPRELTRAPLEGLGLSANVVPGEPADAAFHGYYGEILVYSHALDAAEVASLEAYFRVYRP